VLHAFAELNSDVVVAAEDALGDDRSDGNAQRARLWGFPVGRVLPFGLNTGVLRVTKDHYHLMERWRELLQSNLYQDVQKRDWMQRPIHMLGDQDVLTALLTSKEFSELPIKILRRGKHIIQFNGVWGYTVAERARNLLGDGPMFIHQFGHKPWSNRWQPCSNLREYVKRAYLDVSPYTLTARQFKSEMDCDTDWMEPHYAPTRVLRILGMGHPALVGLPMAIFGDFARLAKWILKSEGVNSSRLEPSATEGASKR
jgi:hypothetical protein